MWGAIKKAINSNLNKSLDILIQEKTTETNSKVDSADAKIGVTNNTGGTASAGSVFAKLNKLLTDWTTTRAGYLDNINTNVGTLLNGRVVKSVQRGFKDLPTSISSEQPVTIPINSVDTSKTAIFITSTNNAAIVIIRLLNSTTLQFTRYGSSGTRVEWQVIEFY